MERLLRRYRASRGVLALRVVADAIGLFMSRSAVFDFGSAPSGVRAWSRLSLGESAGASFNSFPIFSRIWRVALDMSLTLSGVFGDQRPHSA
jgi:hypothetical protein